MRVSSLPTLLLLGCLACGGSPGPSLQPDGGTPDAGPVDAGNPDSGANPDAGGQQAAPPAPVITSDLSAQFTDPQALRLDNFASAAHFSFSSDGATGFVCQLDDAGYSDCASGASISFPGFFDHSLSVKAVAGGVESDPSTVWWRSAMSCTGDASCPETNLAAVDPRAPATDLLIGYADPSLETFEGTSYMAYSWTSSQWPNGVGVMPEVLNIQAHLAKSTNGGDSWSFIGAQFGASGAPESVDLGGQGGVQPGIRSSEEIDIEAATLGNPAKPYWFWIRQQYFNPVSGTGAMKALTQQLRIGMVQADEPSGIGAEEPNEFVFFNPLTPAAFKTQVEAHSRGHGDLVADLLAPHGLACDVQWSASVHYHPQDGQLYFLIECNLTSAGAVTGTTFPVLRVDPVDPNGNVLTPDQWSWEFVGSIGTPTDGFTLIAPRFSADLSGSPANMLIQPSFATGADGALLLVTTPNSVDANGSHRLGCDVTELTLGPSGIAVAVDAFGNPKHRAIVRTPDLDPGSMFGNQAGSCDYDGQLGLYQARKTPRAGGKVVTSINRTGITGL